MSDIDDRVVLGTALRLLNKDAEPPMATCPVCLNPLVSTFEFRGAEFICVVCDKLYGYLSPRPAPNTPELQALHDELKAQYEKAREARQKT